MTSGPRTRAQISPPDSRRILDVDELLTGSEFDPGGDEQQTLDDYALALDAHAAASTLADEAEHPPVLAGVLVLLDIATTREPQCSGAMAGCTQWTATSRRAIVTAIVRALGVGEPEVNVQPTTLRLKNGGDRGVRDDLRRP